MEVHVPAEHKIDGDEFDLELQIFCKDSTVNNETYNRNLAIAILYEEKDVDDSLI
jgi:carbonic anhydrase